VNAAARLGLRHALDAMDAGFVASLDKDLVALDHRKSFLYTAHARSEASMISIFQP